MCSGGQIWEVGRAHVFVPAKTSSYNLLQPTVFRGASTPALVSPLESNNEESVVGLRTCECAIKL